MLFTIYHITGFVIANVLFYLSSACLGTFYIFEILFMIRWWYKQKIIEQRTWENWKKFYRLKVRLHLILEATSHGSSYCRLWLDVHRFVHLPCPFTLRFPPEFLRFQPMYWKFYYWNIEIFYLKYSKWKWYFHSSKV